MPLLDVLKSNFSAGELSPLMAARQDVERVRNGAAQLENWLVLLQGGVARRPGSRYVATVKDSGRLTLLKSFEPSTTEAYILEVGHLYLRFYKNGARLQSAGVPVEVATPYQESDLRLLRTAQSNDVMIVVHGAYQPRRLSRTSDTSWTLSPITFDPPPLFEAGHAPSAALTLSALTGTITITASSGVFLAADQQRQLTAGVGRAVITAVTSATVATAVVRDAFTSTAVAAGAWTLNGSPVAQCKPDMASPVRAQCVLTLQEVQASQAELVTNGTFATGDLTGWSNQSGAVLSDGTHTTGANAMALIDGTADFLAEGVQPTHSVRNITDGSIGIVSGVSTTTISLAPPGLLGGNENDFDLSDAYSIRQTGGVSVSAGSALLSGGTAGVGWIEQALATVAGTPYRVTWQVSDNRLSAQVGSSTKGSQLLAEASYEVGERSLTFTATGATSYLQFRNNQNNTAKVGNVSGKIFSITGFRSADVGSYVVINGGLVRIAAYTSGTQVSGEIVKELRSTTAAVAGAWTLESPAWSDALGWPSAVVLYEGRLYFAGSARFPQGLWGSAIDDFFNFALGPTASDALALSLVDSGGNITLNRIRWLMPAENMLIGTTHGEYRLIGSGDDPLSPVTPPRNRIQSTFGSDTVQPLKVGAALLFAQRQGSKIREMAYDERTTTTFVARDITVLSSHLLTSARVLELAYQQEPLSVVWGVRSDGVLLGLTYDLSEQVLGWHRHTTQGTYESVATIPHPTANAHQTWITVKRTNGRFVEYFDPETRMVLPKPVTITNPLTQAAEAVSSWPGLTVDAGVVYSGAATAVVTGLSHLNGTTVQIVGDGAVFPAQMVVGGQVTLSQAVRTAFVGLGFAARGRTLPVDVALRGTTAARSRKRWVEVVVRVFESLGLVLKGERLVFRTAAMPQDQGVAPFSGDTRVSPLGWDILGGIPFVADQPLPCTLVGLIGVLDVEAEPQTWDQKRDAA